jgi:hypothetical protein
MTTKMTTSMITATSSSCHLVITLSLCCPSNYFFTLKYCWHPGCLLLDWRPSSRITLMPLWSHPGTWNPVVTCSGGCMLNAQLALLTAVTTGCKVALLSLCPQSVSWDPVVTCSEFCMLDSQLALLNLLTTGCHPVGTFNLCYHNYYPNHPVNQLSPHSPTETLSSVDNQPSWGNPFQPLFIQVSLCWQPVMLKSLCDHILTLARCCNPVMLLLHGRLISTSQPVKSRSLCCQISTRAHDLALLKICL